MGQLFFDLNYHLNDIYAFNLDFFPSLPFTSTFVSETL